MNRVQIKSSEVSLLDLSQFDEAWLLTMGSCSTKLVSCILCKSCRIDVHLGSHFREGEKVKYVKWISVPEKNAVCSQATCKF